MTPVREHDTDSPDCWCGPSFLSPCPECWDAEDRYRANPSCRCCRGKGLVPVDRDFSDAPVIIVHAESPALNN